LFFCFFDGFCFLCQLNCLNLCFFFFFFWFFFFFFFYFPGLFFFFFFFFWWVLFSVSVKLPGPLCLFIYLFILFFWWVLFSVLVKLPGPLFLFFFDGFCFCGGGAGVCLNQFIFPPKWCHLGLALICHSLVLDPHPKATGPIYGSQPIWFLYFIGSWTLDDPHLKWPLV